jgi:hypothetical protein
MDRNVVLNLKKINETNNRLEFYMHLKEIEYEPSFLPLCK